LTSDAQKGDYCGNQRTGSVTNKFRDMVGRVTPCAPFGKPGAGCGAHGVTRPTLMLHDVMKFHYRTPSFGWDRLIQPSESFLALMGDALPSKGQEWWIDEFQAWRDYRIIVTGLGGIGIGILVMKTTLALIGLACGSVIRVCSQGYIVPNGVITNYSGAILPSEISVLHDPVNHYYTGFYLTPQGINTFGFDVIVDVSVRVFFVSPNDPISLQPILSQSYAELRAYQNNYVFNEGIPFYVGLYTGNQNFYPPDGIYSDPLFGWAKLVNRQGTIQLLSSALEYGGGGIYAGTQNIIPIPEPSAFSLFALGALLLGWRFIHQRK
jgi:hypothetical protein